MRLTPTERDRLLIFTAAELARARRARGLRLNVPGGDRARSRTPSARPPATARRLAEAIEAGRGVLGPDDVLPGVADVVTEVQVEAVFDDGSRLAVVRDPIGAAARGAGRRPGAVLPRRRAAHAEPRGDPCG